EPAEKSSGPKWTIHVGPDLDDALRGGEIDVAIRLKNTERLRLPLNQDLVLPIDAAYLSNNPAALGALALIERGLASANAYHLETRLGAAGEFPKAAA